MKKIFFVLFLTLILLLTGCGQKNENKVVEEFINKVNKSKSYSVKGIMEIVSNEDLFTYSIEALYKTKDLYRVKLINQTNNHEQIILKNEDGVYIVTPSLNKSFKFQSEWPENSSQAYLLDSLVKDLEKDSEKQIESDDNYYIVTCKVDYPNNRMLNKMTLYFEKENLIKVIVKNNEDQEMITVKFSNIDYKANFENDTFELSSLVKEDFDNDEENIPNDNKEEETPSKNEEETTKTTEEIIYPLFIPSETYLSTKDVVNTDEGTRIILTFSGEKPFMLVEETAVKAKTFEITPIYGEPLLLGMGLGALGNNSLTWQHNGIEYYLTSDNLNSEEIITIAESLNSTSVSTMGEK